VSQLPFEDERFTSPRLSVLKAIYHAVPSFRSLIASSLLSVSNQRFMRCKTSSNLAIMYELDINHTGNKIGDMFSYSIPEHVDNRSAYSCFPIDDIPYPPKKASNNAPLTPAKPVLTPQISSQVISNNNSSASATPPIRDHDGSIIELVLYMIVTTENDLFIPETISNHQEESQNSLKFASSSSLYRIFLSIVINVLRCYGRRLGKTTEGVEQPNILKSCLKGLEEIIQRVRGEYSSSNDHSSSCRKRKCDREGHNPSSTTFMAWRRKLG
jgi:hypothetical protein